APILSGIPGRPGRNEPLRVARAAEESRRSCRTILPPRTALARRAAAGMSAGGGSKYMRVVITGAAGFVGQKLAAALAKAGTLDGERITELALFDVVAPKAPAGAVKITTHVGNIAARADVEALVGSS